MYCTDCGAKVLKKAKFCTECGTKILSGDQEPAMAGQAPEDTSDLLGGFLDSVGDHIGSGRLHDRFGKPLEPLNLNEGAAIAGFALQLLAQGGAKSGFRYYLELKQGSRKTVVAFLGLLSLIGVAAKARGVPMVYVATDSQSLSSARIDFRAYGILLYNVDFMTWDDLESHLQHGSVVDEFWIIGDLDWAAEPLPSTDLQQAIRKAVSAVASSSRSSAVFLHQVGRTAAVDLPLTIRK